MFCTTCESEKPFTTEFFHKHVIEGRTKYKNPPCRECHKRRMKKYNKGYYARNRAREMIREYTRLDNKIGKTNNLTIEWFEENIEKPPCFYCETTEDPRGADRINNNEGHTRDNVVPCCKVCNKVRNNLFTVEEMKLLGQTIKQIRKIRS